MMKLMHWCLFDKDKGILIFLHLNKNKRLFETGHITFNNGRDITPNA